MIRLSEPDISKEALDAVCDVLKSGMLVQGKQVAEFEQALGNYMGAKHVTACSSGTAALHLSLTALGVSRGDAVFVPAFTFPATVNAVEHVGARPILVDVDPETYCLTVTGLNEALSAWNGPENPRTVIVVHEFGAPCEMDKIIHCSNMAGLSVIEDAACALGSRYKGQHVGTFGATGCFSWHPRKAITTGEGGAVVTYDEELYRRLAMLRNHGIEKRPDGTVDFLVPGFNYRLTNFQAALGLAQLDRFSKWLAVRAMLVAVYRRELAGVPGLRLPREVEGHAWQTFMVVLPDGVSQGKIIAELRKRGIETNLGAQGIHMLEYFRNRYGYEKEHYPVAAELFERGLALPLHPMLSRLR
jgi:dTDP-4-amino-4,6-dideoxygalactose transaminase